MESFDADEYGRWLRAADDEAGAARILLDASTYHSAVLHAEQATHLLLKGLLRGVGKADQAVGSHALHGLADACAKHAGMRLSQAARDDLMALSRDYQPTRYPDAVVAGTPRENYSRTHAEHALEVVNATRTAVQDAWEALLLAAQDDAAADGTEEGRAGT